MDIGENREEMQDFIGSMKKYSVSSLLFRVMHRYGSLNFSKFQKLGIHPGQLPVFVILQKQEGISLREMADRLHIKPPTVTVTIQRLEKAGFVFKKPDDKDQRINRIYLTDKGKALSENMLQLVQEDEQVLVEGFSEEEKEMVMSFLQRMVENLMQASQRECLRKPIGRGDFFPE